MRAGHEVIFHGLLAGADWLGEADFLIRVEAPSRLGDYAYEPWETKLARTLRPEFVVQLCAYADLLEAVQGWCPEQLHCVTGDGRAHTFRTADYVYYYRALKSAFVAFLDGFDPDSPPLPNLLGRQRPLAVARRSAARIERSPVPGGQHQPDPGREAARRRYPDAARPGRDRPQARGAPG